MTTVCPPRLARSRCNSAVWDVVRSSPIGAACPASTLLGVERLGYRGQLVEVEAVAVLA